MDSKKDYEAYLKRRFPAKKEFIERIEKLIGKEDAKRFFEICYTRSPEFIRCNTLKVNAEIGRAHV